MLKQGLLDARILQELFESLFQLAGSVRRAGRHDHAVVRGAGKGVPQIHGVLEPVGSEDPCLVRG